VNRRIVHIERGLVRIEQDVRIPGTEIGTDVSGPLCIFADVRIVAGTIAYLQAESAMVTPRRFAIFLPPFAIVQARLDRCAVTTRGIAFRMPSRQLPSSAILLPFGGTDATSVDDALALLDAATGAMDIGRAPLPMPLAGRAKTLLDRDYATTRTIGYLARALNLSAASLSRLFKRTYGMPPVRYRHQLRVMDALLRFAEGAAPTEVALDVGFDDLSRFYKMFRKIACAAPGTYRPKRSKNAKT
jgi:AraC-like DNA-binding protein